MFKNIYALVLIIIFYSRVAYATSYTRMIINEGGGVFGFINAFVGLIVLYIIGYLLLFIINYIRIKKSGNNKITTKELTDKTSDIYIKTCMAWYFFFIPLFTVAIVILFAILSLFLSILITNYHYGDFSEKLVHLYLIFSVLGPIVYALIKAVKESNID